MTARTMAFHAGRTVETPLTWGQLALWAAIQRTRPNDQYFNISRVLDVAGHGADAVLAALAAVVSRHEAMRSRLCDDGPDPVQRVHGAGAYDVELVDAAGDPDATADEIMARFNGRVFDYRDEWPVRAALVVDADGPARLVLGFCHLFSDGAGSQIVLDDIVKALAGTRLEPAPQPAELVAEQHSEAGQRAARAALRHWERELRRIPPTMFPAPVAPPQDPPFWTGEIASPVLGRALAATSARTGINTAAAMTAACAAMVGELTGEDLCAMLVIVMNRFKPERHQLVSMLALEGLVVVGVDRSGSFDELLRKTWGASLQGYRFAEYPEAGRDEVTARVSAERGETIHPYCCYNDVRGPSDETGTGGDGPTTFRWSRKLPKVACRFCLHIHGDGPAGFRVALTADTRYLPPQTIERYLYGVERLLVAAADGDVPLDRLGGMLKP